MKLLLRFCGNGEGRGSMERLAGIMQCFLSAEFVCTLDCEIAVGIYCWDNVLFIVWHQMRH